MSEQAAVVEGAPARDPSPAKTDAPKATDPARPHRPGFFGLELLDNRYPALHGLRVLAILSVVQYHVTWVITTFPDIEIDSDFVDGSLSIFFGMDCFFVLSGFLIGSILLRSIDVSGSQNIRRFYLRRIFRTFPSYWIVLTILATAFPLLPGQREHLVYEYTYLTNFAPLHRDQIIMFWGWSLSLEEQFYLTVPLLFVLLRRLPTDRARISFLAALTLSALFVRAAVYWDGRPWTDLALYDRLYFRTSTRYDTIIAGILLAFVEARHGARIAKFLETPLHRALLAVPAAACCWLLLRPTLFGDAYEQEVHVLTWGTLTSIMYLAVVPMILHGQGAVTRFFSAPIWRATATLGYGVYLVHIPLIDHVGMPLVLSMRASEVSMAVIWPVVVVVVMGLSLLVGYVLHVLVEKPSLRVREWLAA